MLTGNSLDSPKVIISSKNSTYSTKEVIQAGAVNITEVRNMRVKKKYCLNVKKKTNKRSLKCSGLFHACVVKVSRLA